MSRRRLLGTAVVTAALTLAYTVGGPYLDDLLPEEYAEALAQVTGPSAAPSPAAQQPIPPGPIDAEPGPGDAGADANPHQLPAFAAGPARVAEPRRYPDPSLFGQLKAAANRQSAAARKPGGSTTPATASTPRFPTLGYADGGSWNPPDGALAVGPSSVLAAVNESFAIYTKSTG